MYWDECMDGQLNEWIFSWMNEGQLDEWISPLQTQSLNITALKTAKNPKHTLEGNSDPLYPIAISMKEETN